MMPWVSRGRKAWLALVACLADLSVTQELGPVSEGISSGKRHTTLKIDDNDSLWLNLVHKARSGPTKEFSVDGKT
jgi:hypothetical protein